MIKGLAPQSPLLFPPSDLLRLSLEEAGRGRSDLDTLVREIFPGMRAYFLSSGRACLFILLKVLLKQRGKHRNRVVLPAYTCPSVPYTVKQAGLQVLLCDFEPHSFTLAQAHLDRLLDERVLAVLPTHLFGIPSDPASVKRLAGPRGVMVVEDFAHAVGAAITGRPVGTLGDFAFTSLGRGKMLTTDEGGILLAAPDRDTAELASDVTALETDRNGRWGLVLRLGLLYGLIAGRRWGLISRSPIDPEKREKSYGFRPSRLSGIRMALLKDSLDAAPPFNRRRRDRAARLFEGLNEADGLVFPKGPEGSYIVPMMLPVLFKDIERLNKVYARLRREGLGPSRMYRHSLKNHLGDGYINRDEDLPQAEFLAEHLITLPCHPFVSDSDLEKILKTVLKS